VKEHDAEKKRALITGVTGQDGILLAHFLLKKKYSVYGTTRNLAPESLRLLQALKLTEQTEIISVPLDNFERVVAVIKNVRPDEIYHFAGPSSVGLSFAQPRETYAGVVGVTLNLLEAIRQFDSPIRLFNAGSGEMFGPQASALDENSRVAPVIPYAIAKAASYFQVANYRDAYRLHLSTGILFNHESPLRNENFVTKKIARAASRISRGEQTLLELGNINIQRDWGWAPEYIEPIWRMLQQDQPQDFVIASGKTSSLTDYLNAVFGYFNLRWQDHVRVSENLLRAIDLPEVHANPARAERVLGWRAKTSFDEIARTMAEYEKRPSYEWLR